MEGPVSHAFNLGRPLSPGPGPEDKEVLVDLVRLSELRKTARTMAPPSRPPMLDFPWVLPVLLL